MYVARSTYTQLVTIAVAIHRQVAIHMTNKFLLDHALNNQPLTNKLKYADCMDITNYMVNHVKFLVQLSSQLYVAILLLCSFLISFYNHLCLSNKSTNGHLKSQVQIVFKLTSLLHSYTIHTIALCSKMVIIIILSAKQEARILWLVCQKNSQPTNTVQCNQLHMWWGKLW